MLIFEDFLPLKELLVIAFNKIYALTSRKCIFQKDRDVPK